MRIGQGYDVHKLVPDRELILGGVTIPYEKGLLGHSDADVLVHAVMDALLGAAALGDIGQHFPDTDPAYEGASSIELLKKVGKLLQERGYVIENIDATIIAQRRPRPAAEAPAPYSRHAGAPARPARHGGSQCQGDDRGRPWFYRQRRGHFLTGDYPVDGSGELLL